MNNQTWQRGTKRTRPISNGVNKNNFYLKISLIFCGALLCISLYFILFSLSIGGDYRLYVNAGDFVNMASFATVVTMWIIVFFGLNIGKKRMLFLLALTFLLLLLLLLISINRYLAVYPASNAFHLYFYVGILDFFTAIILPVGLGFVVAHIYKKKQTYDPVRSRSATETQNNNYDR